jgi:ribosome maturation factor RimP
MDSTEIENTVAQGLEAMGFELTDLKMASHNGKPLLQIFVDKADSVSGEANGGITLDDCALLSGKLGDTLDAANCYPDGYFLEVSSPGVDRVVKKEKDFRRFAGSQVKVRLKKPVEGSRVFYGNIEGVVGGELSLSGGLKFNLADIDEARLHPADDEIFRRKK